jgi:predicted nucleic acid-binding protein
MRCFIPYTEHLAYEHARIWAELKESGMMIGYDLIAGATPTRRGSTVATFHKRHFARMKGACCY